MKKEFEDLREDIVDEEHAIEETLERLVKVRRAFAEHKDEYAVEPAMGAYLMNFYNGIENILKRICKHYYKTMPTGGSWHKELLVLSFQPPPGKIPVLTQRLVEQLHPYRNFRHRFISGYGFQLKGEKMLELVDNTPSLWLEIKKALADFLVQI